MANIVSINVRERNIFVELKVSEDECKLLQAASYDILMVPTDVKVLNENLTTGTLGNSYRIMLPKKILKRYNIAQVLHRTPCGVFDFNKSKYLVLKLADGTVGVPKFGDSDE